MQTLSVEEAHVYLSVCMFLYIWIFVFLHTDLLMDLLTLLQMLPREAVSGTEGGDVCSASFISA